MEFERSEFSDIILRVLALQELTVAVHDGLSDLQVELADLERLSAKEEFNHKPLLELREFQNRRAKNIEHKLFKELGQMGIGWED